MAELNAPHRSPPGGFAEEGGGPEQRPVDQRPLRATRRAIGQGPVSRAIDNQAELNQDLRALLDLLMSENRAKQAELEKARVREYLKQVNEIIRQEKDIQGRTAGGDEMKRLAREAGKSRRQDGRIGTRYARK